MIEYNERIDQQIAEALRRDGRVASGGIPGLDEEQGKWLLQQYFEAHEREASLEFDGTTLRSAAVPEAARANSSPPSPAAPLSPVDQVLAAPRGKALLDSTPAGPSVNKGFWLLPVSLGLPGGLIAWAMVRQDNPRVARQLLIVGIVMQAVTVVTGMAFGPTFKGLMPH